MVISKLLFSFGIILSGLLAGYTVQMLAARGCHPASPLHRRPAQGAPANGASLREPRGHRGRHLDREHPGRSPHGPALRRPLRHRHGRRACPWGRKAACASPEERRAPFSAAAPSPTSAPSAHSSATFSWENPALRSCPSTRSSRSSPTTPRVSPSRSTTAGARSPRAAGTGSRAWPEGPAHPRLGLEPPSGRRPQRKRPRASRDLRNGQRRLHPAGGLHAADLHRACPAVSSCGGLPKGVRVRSRHQVRHGAHCGFYDCLESGLRRDRRGASTQGRHDPLGRCPWPSTP